VNEQQVVVVEYAAQRGSRDHIHQKSSVVARRNLTAVSARRQALR
jgi:hypothetical protein